MSVKSYADFAVSKISPLNGKSLRALHLDVLGSPAYIEDLEVGYRGVIMYQPEYDDRFHTLHTSKIVSVQFDDSYNEIVVDTVNTRYILTRTNFDESTFRGAYRFTIEEAETKVRNLVKDKPNEYYSRAAESVHEYAKWLGLLPSRIDSQIYLMIPEE